MLFTDVLERLYVLRTKHPRENLFEVEVGIVDNEFIREGAVGEDQLSRAKRAKYPALQVGDSYVILEVYEPETFHELVLEFEACAPIRVDEQLLLLTLPTPTEEDLAEHIRKGIRDLYNTIDQIDDTLNATAYDPFMKNVQDGSITFRTSLGRDVSVIATDTNLLILGGLFSTHGSFLELFFLSRKLLDVAHYVALKTYVEQFVAEKT